MRCLSVTSGLRSEMIQRVAPVPREPCLLSRSRARPYHINAGAYRGSGVHYLQRAGSERLIEVGNDVVHMFDADA
jgi:hypothetical protein